MLYEDLVTATSSWSAIIHQKSH